MTPEEAYAKGAADMRAHIAAWHTKLGVDFATMAKDAERNHYDAERPRWASASHHSHAAAISRMKI